MMDFDGFPGRPQLYRRMNMIGKTLSHYKVIEKTITPENRLPQLLLEDPNLRLKVENKIYKVRATRVGDPTLVSEIQKASEQMSPRLAQRTPEERARNWYFRIDSR